ncbi:hypothetical protein [Thermoproteus tenax]|nr:hypothetical protein [Thermoproteus tenax]
MKARLLALALALSFIPQLALAVYGYALLGLAEAVLVALSAALGLWRGGRAQTAPWVSFALAAATILSSQGYIPFLIRAALARLPYSYDLSALAPELGIAVATLYNNYAAMERELIGRGYDEQIVRAALDSMSSTALALLSASLALGGAISYAMAKFAVFAVDPFTAFVLFAVVYFAAFKLVLDRLERAHAPGSAPTRRGLYSEDISTEK